MAWTAEQIKELRAGLGRSESYGPNNGTGNSAFSGPWTAERVSQLRNEMGLTNTEQNSYSTTPMSGPWTKSDESRLRDIDQQLRWTIRDDPALQQERYALLSKKNAADPNVFRSFVNTFDEGMGSGVVNIVNAVDSALFNHFDEQDPVRLAQSDAMAARHEAEARNESFDVDAYLAERTEYYRDLQNQRRDRVTERLTNRYNVANEALANEMAAFSPTAATSFAAGMGSSIGNLVPSMAVSAATGNPSLGMLAFGSNVYGGSLMDTYSQTGDWDTAKEAAMQNALLEVGVEMLSGGLPGNGTWGYMLADKAGITNSTVRYLLNRLMDTGLEGAEEVVSYLIQPSMNRNLGLEAEEITWAGGLENFASGALTSLLLGFAGDLNNASYLNSAAFKAEKANAVNELVNSGVPKQTAEKYVNSVVERTAKEQAAGFDASAPIREALGVAEQTVATPQNGNTAVNATTDQAFSQNATQGKIDGLVDNIVSVASGEPVADALHESEAKKYFMRGGDILSYKEARRAGIDENIAAELVRGRGDSSIAYNDRQAEAIAYDAETNTLLVNPKTVNAESVDGIKALKEREHVDGVMQSGAQLKKSNLKSDENEVYNKKESSIAMPTMSDLRARIDAGEVISAQELLSRPEIIEADSRAHVDAGQKTFELYPPGANAERDALRSSIKDELMEMGSAVKGEDGKWRYTGAVEQGRHADIIIGPPAAGKSSVFADPLSAEHMARIIDSDEAKKLLPEFDGGYGANRVQEESAYITESLVLKESILNGDNIVIPKVGSSAKSIIEIAEALKQEGYSINIYLNSLPMDKAITRGIGRFIKEGRYVPIEYMQSVGNKPVETFNILKERGDLFDYYEHRSNDVKYGEEPVLIESGWAHDRGNSSQGGGGLDESGRTLLVEGIRPGAVREENKVNAPAYAEAFSNTQNGFGTNTVGAAQSQFKKQQKVRGAAKNSLRNSPMFTAAEKRVLELNSDAGSPYKYDVVSNEESWYNAANRLQADYNGEKQHLSKKEVFSGEDMFTAALMMEVERDNARETGDYTETKRLATMMAEQGTEGGRIIQMLSQIAGTPEGVLVKGETFFLNRAKAWAKKHPKQTNAIEVIADQLRGKNPADISLETVKQTLLDAGLPKNGIDNVAEQMTEYLGTKRNKREVQNALQLIYANGFIELSDADTKRVIDLLEQAFEYPETSRKHIELEKQAYAVIASKMNASALDKWNAWRYLAMLGNTRTHMRNILGNGAFRVVVGAKDSLAGLMEATYNATSKALGGEGIDRTKTAKSLLTKRGKALRQAALKDAENVYALLTQGGKYSDAPGMIEENKKIFKIKPLEWLRDANGKALEFEDWLFLKNDYADSLARYLYANGYTTEVFELNDAYAQEVMEKARKYAIDQAQKATFRNANAAAQGLSQIEQSLKAGDSFASKAGYFLLEGVMPFKNTPFNIFARGVEYSPLGMLSTMKKAFNAVRTGKYTATDVIDSLAANLTGTAILILGKFLADSGILRGSIDDDKEGKAEKLRGHQEYALELGNGSYTIDWLAPAAIPLFIGAELSNLQQEDGETDFNDVLTAALSLAEPITEMTMMQGVNNILEGLSYGEENTALYNIASTALTNYATQGLPTLLGQIARTIDPYRRSSAGDNKGAAGDIEYTVRKAMNKIPGLSFLNEEYIDAWGREQENAGGNAIARGLLQTLSPGYYSKINETRVDAELIDIFEESGDDSVFPTSPSRNAKFDGESRRMTAAEYTEYSETKGREAYSMLDDLFRYYDIPDEYKAAVVGDVYQVANALAKQEVGADLSNDWTAKALRAAEKGIDPLEYILYRNFASTDDNTTISQKEAREYLDDSGLTREQKAFIWEMTNKSWKNNPYR